jgi:hypothetical protein
MTLSRRVSKLEEGLSPTQLLLRWMPEAHGFGDVEPYVASLLAKDPPVAPLDRLAREAAHGARTANRGKRPELVEGAVRSALRETVFRFELVMRINVTVHELLDRVVLIETIFASQLAMLVSDQSKERLADESYLHRLALCRDLTVLRVDELLATQQARSTVEARYLDGHAALFPDIASAFDQQLRRSQELAVMARRCSELDGVKPAEPSDPEAIGFRASQLVADLVEPAKSTALEKLGEGRPAFDIANAWLRTKLCAVPTAAPETPTPWNVSELMA